MGTAFAKRTQIFPFKSPASASDEKTLGYFCCVTGPISCSLNLAKTGFVEGETIMANVGINNQSNKTMEQSTCKLLQKVTYSSGDKKSVRLRERAYLMLHLRALPRDIHVQSRAKKFLLSLVRKMLLGLMGCALAA